MKICQLIKLQASQMAIYFKITEDYETTEV